MFDIVLIDCPPGFSVLTESWLREADFHIPPTKPDHISAYALEVLGHFKGLNPEMGFAENLGVLINMKEMQSTVDADHQSRLMENADNRCFDQAIPRTIALQHASQFAQIERSACKPQVTSRRAPIHTSGTIGLQHHLRRRHVRE